MINIDKTQYTSDSIESLTPLEHVRLRPGVYAGDTSTPNQLLLEIFSNALDEHNIGHGNIIHVNIHDNGICKVQDEGQGFPINVKRDDGLTVLEAAFSVMNTSGKYSDDGVYEGTSLGLNGQGGKIANFLSHYFVVRSWRDGQVEEIAFTEGKVTEHTVDQCNTNLHGTYIQYQPNEEFFGTNKTDINYFKKFFEDICCLCPKLTIDLNGEKITRNGIQDMLESKRGSEIEIINNPLIIDYQNGKNELHLGLTFTGGNSCKIYPYVNYGVTDTGPHITAIKSTITRVFNNWARENDLLKQKDKNLDGNSIQEGMIVAANIVSQNVAYNAQVKTTITKIDSSFISSVLGKELEVWLDNNPESGKIIIEKALLARKAAEAAKKARAAVKNKAGKKKNFLTMPTTLVDCFTKNRQAAELYITEGKSASSSLIAQRDGETQAIYSVRGMMLNVQKTADDKIMQNKEINNLVTALGLEYNPKNGHMIYDKNKLRYGKIIAASDAK